MSLWREVERAWLAPVALPLDIRMAQTGWAADDPGAYCDRCGQPVGAGEFLGRDPAPGRGVLPNLGASELGCASCRRQRLAWDRFVRLGDYDGPPGEWVREVKHARCHWLAWSLGRELGAAVERAGVLGKDPSMRRRAVVVPIPSSFRRRVRRGIDHAGAISRGVAGALGLPLRHALWREHRPMQRGLSPTAREANLKGSMHLRRGFDLAGATVLLVDDVCTSGATLRAACRALRDGARRGSPSVPETIIACVVSVPTEHARRTPPGSSGDTLPDPIASIST